MHPYLDCLPDSRKKREYTSEFKITSKREVFLKHSLPENPGIHVSRQRPRRADRKNTFVPLPPHGLHT